MKRRKGNLGTDRFGDLLHERAECINIPHVVSGRYIAQKHLLIHVFNVFARGGIAQRFGESTKLVERVEVSDDAADLARCIECGGGVRLLLRIKEFIEAEGGHVQGEEAASQR